MTATQAQSYAHLLVRPDWLALTQEAIIEPGRPIVDPHHHLWHDRPAGRYLIEDLQADLATGHNIVATVFMQCGWNHRKTGPEDLKPVGETDAVAATATLSETGAYGNARMCAGIVGYADLRSPGLNAALDAHLAAGGGRFRGIRHLASYDPAILPTSAVVPPPGLLRDPAYMQGVRRLGERGLTYDAWMYHTQLADLLAVTRAAPGTTTVINHVGGPLGCGPYRGQRDTIFPSWRADMQALAACPNVYVKLGGLAMPVNGYDYNTNPVPPSSAQLAKDWAPWMETCIELFGAERCMFESNFPVDKGMCSYPVLWNAFKRIAAGASEADKTALFHDTAARFYKLEL